ncbi:MAG: FixH family protein [Chakrabartia sp.]
MIPARSFTGWHMTAILVGFFTIVVGVNIFMARAAIGSFGGTVVENSYVASQRYNQWLARADAQKQLGWAVQATLSADRHVRVSAQAQGVALDDAAVQAIVRHPLGRTPEQTLTFRRDANGWISATPLPAGRWLVHLTVARGASRYQSIENLQ